MPATRADLTSWFDRGVAQGATHMIVRCDGSFSVTCCYPVFAHGREQAEQAAGATGDRLMEVYVLDPARRDEQLNTTQRVFNYD